VFTKPDYSLGFRAPPGYKKATRSTTVKEPVVARCEVQVSEKQANRSSAVSVKLGGLNLAYALGVVSEQQLMYLSAELGKCCAAFWMEYDEIKNVRYITCSAADKLFQAEVKNEDSWTQMFDFIVKQHGSIKKRKEKLLQPFLNTLYSFPQDTSSPYKTCLRHFSACIKHLKVIVFSFFCKHGYILPNCTVYHRAARRKECNN
jgi:hypothetical protein